MNLILQSLHKDNAAAYALATLSVPSKITTISPTAWCCESFTYADGLKEEINAACQIAKFEYAFVPP